MSAERPVLRIPLPGELWRHTKTEKRVVIVALARDEASSETLVLYRHDAPGDNGTVWSRPLGVFLEAVKDAEGDPVTRFQPAELHPIRK